MASAIVQKAWHIWCRALLYSWLGVFLVIWLSSLLFGAIVLPLAIYYESQPETLLAKINLGTFCVSVSFLVLATFSACSSITLEDDWAADSSTRNVASSILKKIAKVSATAGFHVLAVSGLVLFVRTIILITGETTHGP